MFDDDIKLTRRMAPLLQKVLIVDPNPASTRMLSDLMRDISLGQVFSASANGPGLATARQLDPQLIFVELAADEVDGVGFASQIRRGHLPCRKAPIIMLTSNPTAAGILAARDSGVHEFLRRPYNMGDLLKRLEAVTLRTRDWIEAVAYVGPDRRRFNSADYAGDLKRKTDLESTDAAKILQALRIIKAAVLAIDADPAQAMRALKAQAADLQVLAQTVGDARLAAASGDFHLYLVRATDLGVMVPSEALTYAGPLLSLLPKDVRTPLAQRG